MVILSQRRMEVHTVQQHLAENDAATSSILLKKAVSRDPAREHNHWHPADSLEYPQIIVVVKQFVQETVIPNA